VERENANQEKDMSTIQGRSTPEDGSRRGWESRVLTHTTVGLLAPAIPQAQAPTPTLKLCSPSRVPSLPTPPIAHHSPTVTHGASDFASTGSP
jgi:hypothetical protein